LLRRVPIEPGRAYAAGIAGAQLVVIPECDPAPSIEKLNEFPGSVIPFVDGQ
jgi:hypothetical protein